MGEVIVITSGKGGVGKTTATANIGIGLSLHEKRVIAIDTDLGLRNLDLVMGLENQIVYNLVDVIENRCHLKQALIQDKNFPNLYVLPAAQTKDKSAVSSNQMKEFIIGLKNDFDYILLDCPTGIEQGFETAISGADRSLVITTLDASSIRDSDRIIRLLESRGIKQNDLVINRLYIDMMKRGTMMSVEDVLDILPIRLLGVIPDEEQVLIATNQGKPVVGTACVSGLEYQNICKRLLGEEIPLTDFCKQTTFLSKMSHIIQKHHRK